MSFISGNKITATQFMEHLVTYYNDYWSDPAGSFSFDNQHTIDLERRKGWGQNQVIVKSHDSGNPPDETSVSLGQAVEAVHINAVIAQINAGLQHIDNSISLIDFEDASTLITASEVAAVKQVISGTIDTRKFQCLDDFDLELELIPNGVSNGGVAWSDDLYIEHTYTFTDYNHARHFFNGGGELTIGLDMAAGNAAGIQVWDEIFESFGYISIGAVNSQVTSDESYAYQAPNLVPNRGFYSLPHTEEYTVIFETAGAFQSGDPNSAYIFAYVQSAYNSRRIRVEGKASEDGITGAFSVTIKVTLIEDEDDTFDITGNITITHGSKTADISPSIDPVTENMDPYSIPFKQFRFQTIAHPTLALTTTWTSTDVSSPEQVTWSENDPGVVFEETNTETFNVATPTPPNSAITTYTIAFDLTNTSVTNVNIDGTDLSDSDYSVVGQDITIISPVLTGGEVITITIGYGYDKI